MSPVIKISPAYKMSPHYMIALPEKSLSGRQFTGKNRPVRPPARRAGRSFASKLSAGGDFSGGAIL